MCTSPKLDDSHDDDDAADGDGDEDEDEDEDGAVGDGVHANSVVICTKVYPSEFNLYTVYVQLEKNAPQQKTPRPQHNIHKITYKLTYKTKQTHTQKHIHKTKQKQYSQKYSQAYPKAYT